jgi:tetratricopeptide (TPR) repeat protein
MQAVKSFVAALALAALVPLAASAQSDAVSYARSFADGAEHFDAGRYEEALEAYLLAARANPEDAEVLFNVGRVYEKLGRLTEASVAYRRAVELRPAYLQAQARLCSVLVEDKRFWDGLEACGRAIKLDREDAVFYYQYGRAFAGAGLHGQAADALARAVRLRPDFKEAHYELGRSYRALGEYSEALDSLERAGRLGGGWAEAKRACEEVTAEMEELERELASVEGRERLMNLGHGYRAKGWYARAAAVYRKAVRDDAEDARAHYFLGLTYYQMNRYYRAAECYRKALKIDPQMREARESLDWLTRYLKNRPEDVAAGLSQTH